MPTNTEVSSLVSVGVAQRSKWDRKSGKRLAKKVYVARLIYLDNSGKKREKTKEFLKKKDADDYGRDMRNRFSRSGGREIDGDRMIFSDLLDHYEDHYAKPAEYSEDRKIAGLRSLGPVKTYIAQLRGSLGKLELKKITYGIIREYRSARLRTPVTIMKKNRVALTEAEREKIKTRKRFRDEVVETTRPRKIASVNRELTTLRHILSIAETEGWIVKNPFKGGPGLVQISAETMRQRILTREEEERLLAVCDAGERLHLKAIVICLLDTGMRFGELKTLTWDGVDLHRDEINIRAFNTKIAKDKTVAITNRLRDELVRLIEGRLLLEKIGDPNSHLVFGIQSNVRSSWTTARRLAGIEGLRLHDLRHTFGTRLNQLGLSQASIARSLGHQQLSTTYRYINADRDLTDSVRTALDRFNSP